MQRSMIFQSSHPGSTLAPGAGAADPTCPNRSMSASGPAMLPHSDLSPTCPRFAPVQMVRGYSLPVATQDTFNQQQRMRAASNSHVEKDLLFNMTPPPSSLPSPGGYQGQDRSLHLPTSELMTSSSSWDRIFNTTDEDSPQERAPAAEQSFTAEQNEFPALAELLAKRRRLSWNAPARDSTPPPTRQCFTPSPHDRPCESGSPILRTSPAPIHPGHDREDSSRNATRSEMSMHSTSTASESSGTHSIDLLTPCDSPIPGAQKLGQVSPLFGSILPGRKIPVQSLPGSVDGMMTDYTFHDLQ